MVTFEQEDSVLRNFGNPLHVLSALTSAQCLVVPSISIRFVKYRLTCAPTPGVGVDFIAERKDNDQIGRLDRRYGVLENRQTVGVFITRSNFLLVNEHSQVNSHITVLFNPFIVGLCPIVSRHVGVVETRSVN